MNIKYPEYGNCIANLACSIMKHFGVEDVENPTLPLADSLLAKECKNVVVLLLDGMGKCILERNLTKDGFFNSNVKGVYSSVFPPTTVAATTSIDSGLYPSQHGWLGWDCYFPQLGQNVTVYRNCISATGMPAADYNVAFRYCPYESVVNRIHKAGGQAYYASPFQEPYPSDLDEICDRIQKLCKEDGKKYIYAYWNQPDSVMHEKGCYAEVSVSEMRWIENTTEEKEEFIGVHAGLTEDEMMIPLIAIER